MGIREINVLRLFLRWQTLAMRTQNLYIALLFGLTTTYGYSQHKYEEIKSIQDSIRLELSDTLNSKWVKSELNKMIELLNSPDSLFPYTGYDSVTYFRYGTKDKFEPSHWNKIYSEYVFESKSLTAEEVTSILTTINNPLNFNWGECSTPVIEGAIIFYKSGNQIAKVERACSGGQIFTTPSNALIRWGILNDQGRRSLNKIMN